MNKQITENQMPDSANNYTEPISQEKDSFVEEASPLELWVQKNPNYRQNEILYIQKAELGYPYVFTENGDLQQPFTVHGWTFLLVLDKSFPKETEYHELPIRVYLVNPGLTEFKRLYDLGIGNIPCVFQDDLGMAYLYFEDAVEALKQYVNNRHSMCMSEVMIINTNKWAQSVQHMIERDKKQKSRRAFGNLLWPNTSNAKQNNSIFRGRAKYIDGRISRSNTANPKCQKVVLSNRALIQIFNESQSRIETETGGLLLGHYEHGIWYVVEASDPGINAVFRVAYHEGDDVYQNHVCDVISRTYKHPLVFLGMWHRHPGSLDSFSGTDDGTNFKYAASVGNGCISAIINYDPEFRITFYYAEQDDNRGVRYTKVDVEVGDDKIPNKEIMMLADMNDVMDRLRREHQ